MMTEEKKFTATLTQEQWSIISIALSELPYKMVALIVTDLNSQFATQADHKAKVEE